MEKREQARKLYQESGGKMPLKDIAAQLDVSESTLRSWKKRDAWGKDPCNVAALQGAATQREKQRQRRAQTNRKAAEAIENNPGLNDAERDFCLQYVQAPNRVEAAMMTGRYSDRHSARTAAWKMMQNPAVKAEIERLKIVKRSMALSDIDDLIDFLEHAAYSNINSVVDFTRGGFKLKSSKTIDGSIICEVSKSKGGGVRVKRIDPLKAAELLCRIRGDFAAEKHQIDGEINVGSPRDEIDSRIAGIAAKLGTPENTE